MIEIIIIILIGKQFLKLAKNYEKDHAWVYALLGVLAYYGGAFVAGFFIGLYGEIAGYYDILGGVNTLVLTLIFIPIGALSCWGVYQLLKRKWQKEFEAEQRNKPRIEDIGKSDDEELATQRFLPNNTTTNSESSEKNEGFRF